MGAAGGGVGGAAGCVDMEATPPEISTSYGTPFTSTVAREPEMDTMFTAYGDPLITKS